MSSTAAATVTSTGSTASASATPACNNLYVIPVDDPGCAVPFSSDNKDSMSACCKSAAVISYSNDCGLYCAASDQTIKDLQDCLFGKKVAYQNVFCNANVNATATDANPSVPASASASVVSGGDDNDNGGSGSDSSSGATASPSDSGSAAPRMAPEMGVSKAGLTIGALLFSAMAFGAFQI
ncbi:hypothetical protein F4678DRAFT_165530 [Xylaria arbuscula]|nr:hypothetical protein F4678DRAFT_165530 [Xylaria arbuscula]